jgi:nucleotide-binding universal stress UspA family protein
VRSAHVERHNARLGREALLALITSILYPVDFSPSCTAMAPYVKRAAALFGARVSLVHVVDPAIYEVSEEHLGIARERLDSFLAADFPVTQCPRIMASGDAATEIARVAKDGLFSFIIMPTHAGIFRQMLLGSTTAKVLNDADCPVLTSRHAQTIAPRPLEHREGVCAIGLSANSERVLRYASQVATEARAKLSIIHAVQDGNLEPSIQLDLREQLHLAARREASQRIADLQRFVGTEDPVRIAIGPVKEALLEAALGSDADVLMIGRSPQRGAYGRMRDLTYSMVRDSPFPVLSV